MLVCIPWPQWSHIFLHKTPITPCFYYFLYQGLQKWFRSSTPMSCQCQDHKSLHLVYTLCHPYGIKRIELISQKSLNFIKFTSNNILTFAFPRGSFKRIVLGKMYIGRYVSRKLYQGHLKKIAGFVGFRQTEFFIFDND